jgi:hypothetical protein
MTTSHALLLTLLLTLAGCFGIVQQPAVTRTLTVPDAPEAAYTRALDATRKVGGVLWQRDTEQRLLQAFVGQGGERLTVQIRPQGTGSTVLVETQRSTSVVNPGTSSHLLEEFVYAYQTR